jgi:hypothetical protein
MFIAGMYITVDFMEAMKDLDKESMDLSLDVMKEWANYKRALIVKDSQTESLVRTGFFEIDQDIKTTSGFRALRPYEYADKAKPEQLTIDYGTVTTYVPGLIDLFTNITGIEEIKRGGKRNFGTYNKFWRNPVIEMINMAPGETTKDKANVVAKAMPEAIQKQKASGYKIVTPNSILKFVIGELEDWNKASVVEAR